MKYIEGLVDCRISRIADKIHSHYYDGLKLVCNIRAVFISNVIFRQKSSPQWNQEAKTLQARIYPWCKF